MLDNQRLLRLVLDLGVRQLVEGGLLADLGPLPAPRSIHAAGAVSGRICGGGYVHVRSHGLEPSRVDLSARLPAHAPRSRARARCSRQGPWQVLRPPPCLSAQSKRPRVHLPPVPHAPLRVPDYAHDSLDIHLQGRDTVHRTLALGGVQPHIREGSWVHAGRVGHHPARAGEYAEAGERAHADDGESESEFVVDQCHVAQPLREVERHSDPPRGGGRGDRRCVEEHHARGRAHVGIPQHGRQLGQGLGL
ncbi:hypothetical protein BDY21DRAFT_145586 [Lineolata rhizophorae]|uniref:Uncharacterized protein n=1 Tax=Lineolata rhizophorae TaxID=578093 RepID=A0A6A6NN04_9PEZI|nr:hypothetical protein BDY21DRAFT_145586 [Lineolata rhizophorae]